MRTEVFRPSFLRRRIGQGAGTGMSEEGGVLIGPVARRDSGFGRSGQFSGFRDGNRN